MTDLDNLVEAAMTEWNPQWKSAPREVQEHQWRAMRRVVRMIQEAAALPKSVQAELAL